MIHFSYDLLKMLKTIKLDNTFWINFHAIAFKKAIS